MMIAVPVVAAVVVVEEVAAVSIRIHPTLLVGDVGDIMKGGEAFIEEGDAAA